VKYFRGILTTEFWTTIGSIGLVVSHLVSGTGAVVAVTVANAAYAISRGMAKHGQVPPP
jgi:hypothetical protein